VTGNSDVEVMKLDFNSLNSVREFVKEFLQKEKRLDVLINNAAASGMANRLTEDGLQQQMQINHFGPFLLTILLLGKKKKNASVFIERGFNFRRCTEKVSAEQNNHGFVSDAQLWRY